MARVVALVGTTREERRRSARPVPLRRPALGRRTDLDRTGNPEADCSAATRPPHRYAPTSRAPWFRPPPGVCPNRRPSTDRSPYCRPLSSHRPCCRAPASDSPCRPAPLGRGPHHWASAEHCLRSRRPVGNDHFGRGRRQCCAHIGRALEPDRDRCACFGRQLWLRAQRDGGRLEWSHRSRHRSGPPEDLGRSHFGWSASRWDEVAASASCVRRCLMGPGISGRAGCRRTQVGGTLLSGGREAMTTAGASWH